MAVNYKTSDFVSEVLSATDHKGGYILIQEDEDYCVILMIKVLMLLLTQWEHSTGKSTQSVWPWMAEFFT